MNRPRTRRAARPRRPKEASLTPGLVVPRRPRTTPDDKERAVLALLDQIEAAAGPDVRALAEHAAARATEAFTRHMFHDVMNHVTRIQSAMDDVAKSLEQPALDPRNLAQHVAGTAAKARRLFNTFRRAREVVLGYRAHHCLESLAPVVEEARAAAALRLGARAAQFAFTSSVPDGLSFHADHPELLCALEEVILNAAESYAESAPRAEVTLTARARRTKHGRVVEIVVADHGRGIDPETLQWVFVPFGTGKPEGTGLGLNLARKAVEERHDGEITIESVRGQGTRVRIVLPMKQAILRAERRLSIEEVIDRGILPGPEARALMGA